MLRVTKCFLTTATLVMFVASPTLGQNITPEDIVSFTVESGTVEFQLPENMNFMLREIHSAHVGASNSYTGATYEVYENGELRVSLRSRYYYRLNQNPPTSTGSWLDFKSNLGIPLRGGTSITIVGPDTNGQPITLIGYKY